MRELGRFVTTAIRAALLPVVGDYLERVEDKLRAAGSHRAAVHRQVQRRHDERVDGA